MDNSKKHLLPILNSSYISKTNKLRSFYLSSLVGSEINVPLLKNDTKNIVEYKNDIEVYKKKKKYNLFWDLIEK